jgi:putative FmdB family regulatory protein
MPIYEYECVNCKRIEEALQKISDAPLTKCSHCQGKLHKLISHSSFHLKGSGWYVTDYAGAKSGGPNSSGSGGSNESGSSGSCSSGSGSSGQAPSKESNAACKACEKPNPPVKKDE